jgi:hypothetical protein
VGKGRRLPAKSQDLQARVKAGIDQCDQLLATETWRTEHLKARQEKEALQ